MATGIILGMVKGENLNNGLLLEIERLYKDGNSPEILALAKRALDNEEVTVDELLGIHEYNGVAFDVYCWGFLSKRPLSNVKSPFVPKNPYMLNPPEAKKLFSDNVPEAYVFRRRDVMPRAYKEMALALNI